MTRPATRPDAVTQKTAAEIVNRVLYLCGAFAQNDGKAEAASYIGRALSDATARAVPEGHVVVPLEPTEEMIKAAQAAWHDRIVRKVMGQQEWSADGSSFVDNYRAMLSAAPGPHDATEDQQP